MIDQKEIDTVFLALALWREARGESDECKTALAFSILNRVERPSWWGKDVQSVLFKKWQYSSLTDPKDKQLTKWPQSDDMAWLRCVMVASNAMEGLLVNPVPGADSYFDISIPDPKWATPETFVRQIGTVKFYNVDMDYEGTEWKDD